MLDIDKFNLFVNDLKAHEVVEKSLNGFKLAALIWAQGEIKELKAKLGE